MIKKPQKLNAHHIIHPTGTQHQRPETATLNIHAKPKHSKFNKQMYCLKDYIKLPAQNTPGTRLHKTATVMCRSNFKTSRQFLS